MQNVAASPATGPVMMYFNFKAASMAAAILLGTLSLAMAQAYDPMRPAQKAPATTPADSAAVVPNPEFDNLPDAPGVEDTFYMCTACHSAAIIKQQKLSDARWDYLWQWMIEDQGMADPGDEMRETILTYLKEHFSSER